MEMRGRVFKEDGLAATQIASSPWSTEVFSFILALILHVMRGSP